MRLALIFVAIFLGFLNLSMAEEAKYDMSSPPFWMSSYDEFHDLRPEQKEFYLKQLLVSFKKIPSLEKVTKEKLDEASEWYQTWDSLRRKLYQSCLEKELKKSCEEIADVRIQALELGANQKLENRHAKGVDLDEKSEEPPVPKKKK